MPYAMHRVFCATPGDLEEEREAFYKVISEVNETSAMPNGMLLVSISLPGTTVDKRPYQAVLGENIRSCRYYIQILEDSWGPRERNFERDYALAMKCLSEPGQPMAQVAVFFKKPLLPHQVESSVVEFKQKLSDNAGTPPHFYFETPEQFASQLRELASGWVQNISSAAVA